MKLLMIATSHAGSGAIGAPSGLWLEELAVPYRACVEAGHEVAIASVQGGAIPLDPRGFELTGETPEEVGRFVIDPVARDRIAASLKLETVAAEAYGAIFLPGGYGAMVDLPEHPALGILVGRFLAEGKPVAAVGHGVAGLLPARHPAGDAWVSGRRLTCFSDLQEASLGLSDFVPFLLETRLRALGARVATGPEFKPFVVEDGALLTGQNPASTAGVTRALLRRLR